jgi:hypothetical protein
MSCLLQPFVALWHLATFTIKMIGRMVVVVLGVILMMVGAIMCFTIIGAVIGIPLILFGFLLVARGLF